MARLSLSLGLLTLCLVMAYTLPSVVAHPPPPETGGIVFTLSGSEQSLIRGQISEADSSDTLVTTGSNDLGSWYAEELTAPLKMENTTATLVLYAMPVGIVVGQGIDLEVSVLIDGEEVAYGQGDVVILNEPLMTNVPWVSEPFSFEAEAGQLLEVAVIANLDGFGGAQITWGQDDAPAVFGLAGWVLQHSADAVADAEGAALGVEFSTPWNCTDIESVSLLVHGPVADHDEPWPEEALPGEVEVTGEGCAWAGNVSGLSGTLLYQWQVDMTDGEEFNLTGDIEVEMATSDSLSGPTFSLLGGILGTLLVLVPILSLTTQNRVEKITPLDRALKALEPENRAFGPMAVWLVIGVVTGLLAGPAVALLILGTLALLFWVLD
jgi:hypothetical protein